MQQEGQTFPLVEVRRRSLETHYEERELSRTVRTDS